MDEHVALVSRLTMPHVVYLWIQLGADQHSKQLMARRSSSRRLSLDLIQRAVSDLSADGGILKYMDLRLPSSRLAQSPLRGSEEVREVRCECCDLAEDCTRAYVRRIRERFCGRWVCGLCSEAVNEEHERLGLARHAAIEEQALTAHMEVCRRYNKVVRTNPAMCLVGTMAEILRKGCKKNVGQGGGGACKVLRSYSDVPSHCA